MDRKRGGTRVRWPLGAKIGNSTLVLLSQLRASAFWFRCPATRPQRSRPGNCRKSRNGKTGSPSPSSQREDGEPEESVVGASRSDSAGKQVSYCLAGAGGLEAGTVRRQRGAWGRWLEGRGAGGWTPGAPPGPFTLPPPPAPRLRPSLLAGPSRHRPDSPRHARGSPPPPPPGLRSRPPRLAARPAPRRFGFPAAPGCQRGSRDPRAPARSRARLTARFLRKTHAAQGLGVGPGRGFLRRPPPFRPPHPPAPAAPAAPPPPLPPAVKDAGRAAAHTPGPRARRLEVEGPGRSGAPGGKPQAAARRRWQWRALSPWVPTSQSPSASGLCLRFRSSVWWRWVSGAADPCRLR